MIAETLSSLRPSLPPGCSTWKSSPEKPLRSSMATASASPSASITVVEVVGASPMGQASGASGSSSTTSAACARVLCRLAVMAISPTVKRLA